MLEGSTEPRVFTPPLRDLTAATSWGFDVAWFAREVLGEPLTLWQEWLAIHALELLPPERVRALYPTQPEVWDEEIPRFKTVLVLVARQNGKTHWAKVLIKWALFRKRLPYILGAAQTKNDAFELWEQIRDECELHPKLKKRMRRTSNAHGFEALRSRTGQYRIAGLDKKDGRGKTVNLLYLDELREHKSWAAWKGLTPTTKSPLVGMNVCTTNAGDDQSVVLNSLQDKAHEAIESGRTASVTVGLFEWSAHPSRDVDDPLGWAEANPDLGHGRMSARDIEADMESMDPDGFRTEVLCQRVRSLESGKLDPEVWDMLADSGSAPADDAEIFTAVDVSLDGERAHIAVCAKRPDGLWHIEIVHSAPGYTWVPGYLNARRGDWFTGRVGLQQKGCPAAALVPVLENEGIEIVPWQGSDMSGAVLGFYDAIRDGLIRHRGRDESAPDTPVLLEQSAKGAKERRAGDVFIWSRENSLFDATPFIATNIAWWLASKPQDRFESAYAADDYDDPVELDELEDSGSGDDDYLLIV